MSKQPFIRFIKGRNKFPYHAADNKDMMETVFREAFVSLTDDSENRIEKSLNDAFSSIEFARREAVLEQIRQHPARNRTEGSGRDPFTRGYRILPAAGKAAAAAVLLVSGIYLSILFGVTTASPVLVQGKPELIIIGEVPFAIARLDNAGSTF